MMINSFNQVVKYLSNQSALSSIGNKQSTPRSGSRLGPIESYSKEQLYQMLQEAEANGSKRSFRKKHNGLSSIQEPTRREADLSALVENTSEFILSLNRTFRNSGHQFRICYLHSGAVQCPLEARGSFSELLTRSATKSLENSFGKGEER